MKKIESIEDPKWEFDKLPNNSRSSKTHKFFEVYLENDLEALAKFLHKKYSQIEQAELPGVSEVGSVPELWVSSGSTSTVKWREYNAFQFYHPSIYNLYKGIAQMTREACEYYEIDYESQQFMIQGWFNINYNRVGKLDWHDHGGHGAPNFHGYYSIKAEPTVTHYKVFGNHVENVNKNNKAILSETGHFHAMGDWDWDGPRITLAYDVAPLREIAGAPEQHWVPLA